MGGGKLSAQTDDTWTDVTDTYINNADFEGEYEKEGNKSSNPDRYRHTPEGWTLKLSSLHQYDYTILEDSEDNGTGLGKFKSASLINVTNGGSKTYRVRFYGSSTTRNLTLSQTKSLPVGIYKLSAYTVHKNSNNKAKIYLGDKEATVTSTTWNNVSTPLLIQREASSVEMGFRINNRTDNTEFLAGFDNFKLEKLNVTGLSLTGADEVELGRTTTLTLGVTPSSSAELAAEGISYTSSNTAVATVGSNGEVTGVSTGSATITVSYLGVVTGTHDIEVTAPAILPTEVSIAGGGVTIKNGTVNLSSAITPSEAVQDVTWSSSDEAIATVDANGVVTATGYGTVTITATAVAASTVSGSTTITIEKKEAEMPSGLTSYEETTDDYVITYSIGPNLITNGSFEYINPLEGWKNDKGTDASAAKFSTADGYLKGLADEGSGKEGALVGAWRIDANKKYLLGFKYRNTTRSGDSNAKFRIVSLSDDGKLGTTEFTVPSVNDNSWQDAQVLIDNKDGKQYVSVNFRFIKNAKFDDFYLVELTKASKTVNRTALETEIATAQALHNTITAEAVQGDAVFQYSEATATALQAAITTAQNATLSTLDDRAAAIEALQTAVAAVRLNAPTAGQAYRLVNTSTGYGHTGKAVTYTDGSSNPGGYNLAYAFEPNSNLTQAFYFEALSGADEYNIYFNDINGDKRYICTGAQNSYGGNSSQMRTIVAGEGIAIATFKISNNGGAIRLCNTDGDIYVSASGQNNNGFYCNNSGNYKDFSVTPIDGNAKVSVSLTAGQWGTLMVPFNAALPAGLKAYSTSTATGGVLDMDEATTLEANTPYIIYSENGVSATLEGLSVGQQPTYTSGSLTGCYEASNVPTGKYAMQEAEGVYSFRLVEEATAVTLSANSAYYTDPAATASGREEFTLDNSSVILPTSIALNETEVTLDRNTPAFTLTATIAPEEAEAEVTWTSSNEEVATVDAESGVVTAVANGTATITATSTVAGSVTASATITVAQAESELPTTVTITDADYITTYTITGGNLIKNGSFEYINPFEHWTAGDGNALRTDRFSAITEGAANGDVYLKALENGEDSWAMSISTAWQIEAGKKYVFGYSYKDYGSQYQVVSLTNTKGSETEKISNAFNEQKTSASPSWQTQEYVFDNPETDGYQFIQARFRWLGKTAAFDNFYLAEAEQASQVINPAALNDVIAAAESRYAEITADAVKGDGVFQYSAATALALQTAINTAKAAELNTVDDRTNAISALQEAIDAIALNAPAANQAYALANTTEAFAHTGKAVTIGTRNDEGGYTLGYTQDYDQMLAQAFYFDAVEGGYAIWFNDFEGNKRYLCTQAGGAYGSSTQAVRTTTEAEQALVFTASVTPTGAVRLLNTEAGKYVGSNGDTGLFTADNQNCDFSVTPVSGQATVSVNLAAGQWSTLMVPFAHALPTNIEAYSASNITNGVLDLEAADALAANTPYIIHATAAVETELTGVSTASQPDNHTAGLLTGNYTATIAAPDAFVLQTKNSINGFYRVAEDEEISIAACGAYITAPEGTDPARILFYLNSADVVAPTELALNMEAVTLNRSNSSAQLLVNEVTPSYAEKAVTWSSSDENVATVNEFGMVTPVANGTATITATSTKDDEVTATVSVTVAQAESTMPATVSITDDDYIVTYTIKGSNLIKNGSFEYINPFEHWTAGDGNALRTDRFTAITEGAANGDVYLKALENGEDTWAMSISTAWQIEAGKKYVFGYSYKDFGSKFQVVSLTDTEGTETELLSNAFNNQEATASSEWQTQEYVFDNPETDGYQFIQARFRWLGKTAAFDNFYLAEAEESERVVNATMLASVVAEAEAKLALLQANEGDDAFQYSTATISALQAAIDGAKAEKPSVTTTGLREAMAAVVINAPAATQAYALTNISEGFAHSNKAITLGTRNDEGGYTMGYTQEPNPYLAQAFFFEAVDAAKAEYRISFNGFDGQKRYLRTGYGENDTQKMRATTTAEDALTVVVTAEDGIRLLNTQYGQYIGSNGDQGVFTDENGNNSKFAAKAISTEAEVAISMNAGQYATVMLPFAGDVPEGLTAYTVQTAAAGVISVEKATTLEANKPYLIYAEKSVNTTLSGISTASQTTYSNGRLTGTYNAIAEASTGWYVLDERGEKTAFYIVEEGETVAVAATTAYLTAAAGETAELFNLAESNRDALNEAIAAAEAKTLGFDAGEYAPYNNTAALEALAAAREAAAKPSPDYTDQSVIDGLTDALTGATWTVNAEEVNAVYDGDFRLSTNDGAVPYWSGVETGGYGNSRAFVYTSADNYYTQLGKLQPEEGTRAALYLRWNPNPGAWYNYGTQGHYTMPLNADEQYELTCDFGQWGEGSSATQIEVYEMTEDNTWTSLGYRLYTAKNIQSNENAVRTHICLPFTPQATGKCRISVWSPGDTKHYSVITNIVVKHAKEASNALTVVESMPDGDNANFIVNMPVEEGEPETYSAQSVVINEGCEFANTYSIIAQTVTYDRPFGKKKSTLCLPYAISAEKLEAAGLKAWSFYKFDSEEGTLHFREATNGTEAGVPYLISNDGEESTIGTISSDEGIVIQTASEKSDAADNTLTFCGTYSHQTLKSNDEYTYYGYAASNSDPDYAGEFVKVGSTKGATIAPFRAYFKMPASASAEVRSSYRLKFGDDADEIAAPAATQREGVTYDLSGRRVSTARKGVYIVDGKKVMY